MATKEQLKEWIVNNQDKQGKEGKDGQDFEKVKQKFIFKRIFSKISSLFFGPIRGLWKKTLSASVFLYKEMNSVKFELTSFLSEGPTLSINAFAYLLVVSFMLKELLLKIIP